MAFAAAWSARHRQPGQHKGPLTRAFLEVLEALLWGFHNAHTGACFPSYESIAAKAGCARSTVAEAVNALEWAGVLTWRHRIVRIRERCADLFGQRGWRWRVLRTSNAYVFRDPKMADSRPVSSKSENPTGTLNQDLSSDLPAVPAPVRVLSGPLERALARFRTAIQERLLGNGSGPEAVAS
jgi:DNA-binding transcriptional MocR family regulator